MSLTQPMKNKIKLKSLYSLTQPVDFFFLLNDRTSLIFNVLLTLEHTFMHA